MNIMGDLGARSNSSIAESESLGRRFCQGEDFSAPQAVEDIESSIDISTRKK